MKRLMIVAALLLGACRPASEDNQAANDALADAGDNTSRGSSAADPSTSPDDPATDDDGAPPAGDNNNVGADPVPDPVPVPADCPILSSRNWAAVVNAMPGPNARPRLIVTGEVTTPTAGYRPALRLGQIMESHPVQVNVRLNPNAPSGPAAAVVTRHDLRGTWPMAPPVGSVTVRCGSKVLARISRVETAH